MNDELNRVKEAEEARMGRTVSGTYQRDESIEAEAYKKREKKKEAESRVAEEAERYAEEAVKRARTNARVVAQTQRIQQQGAASASVASRTRGASSLARWSGLGIAATSYFFTLVLSLISLMGFGFDESFVGKAVNAVSGFFFGIEKSGQYIGNGFWIMAVMITLCTFLGFLLWFYFTGVKVMRTPVSAMVTTMAFALSIAPLIPGVILWVVYINVTETLRLFSSVKTVLKDS